LHLNVASEIVLSCIGMSVCEHDIIL